MSDIIKGVAVDSFALSAAENQIVAHEPTESREELRAEAIASEPGIVTHSFIADGEDAVDYETPLVREARASVALDGQTQSLADEILTVPTEPKQRSTRLADTRNAKFAEVFEGKKFVVEKEVHLPKGQVFKTPFNNKGRNGFIITEVDADGQIIMTEATAEKPPVAANRFVVGITQLQKAHDLYDAVDVPAKPSRGSRRDEETVEV